MLHSIIHFYLLYGAYLDGFFIWIRIVVAVLVGIICANNFNKTNEKDLVVDLTMGSGSCGVASVNTNRNFIGIEMNDNYFEIAQKRINEI